MAVKKKARKRKPKSRRKRKPKLKVKRRPPKGGQPTKFTALARRQILKAIRVGVPLTKACLCGGIQYTTFRNWMLQGEAEIAAKAKGEHRDFVERVEIAKGKAVEKWLGVIEQAAKLGVWTAAAWKLERLYPSEFGRRDRTEITGADGKPIETRTIVDIKELQKPENLSKVMDLASRFEVMDTLLERKDDKAPSGNGNGRNGDSEPSRG